jgi:membrane peptidoglycan carboxypeptidase
VFFIVVIYLKASGFSRYLALHLSNLKVILKRPFKFESQVAFIALVCMISNWFFQYYSIELISYILNFTKGIEEFQHTTRGVIDLNNNYQGITWIKVIVNGFVRPLVAFAGIAIMYETLNFVLFSIAKKFPLILRDRSSLTFYTMSGVFLHIGITSIFYAQSNIVARNVLVLILESIAYITICILFLAYKRRIDIVHYINAPGGNLNRVEKLALHNPAILIFIGICIYNVMLLPKNVGMPFYKPEEFSFFLLLISLLLITYFTRKHLFKNLLAALVDIIVSSDRNQPYSPKSLNIRVVKKILLILGVGLCIVFFTSISKLAFVFWIGLSIFALLQMSIFGLGSIAFMETIGLAIKKSKSVMFPLLIWKKNYKFYSVLVSQAVLPLIVILLVCFTLYTLAPLPSANYRKMVSNTLLDSSGELVQVDFKNQILPAVEMRVENTWLNRMIIAQEDNHLRARCGWLPHYNNFNGLNITNFFGSNILNQLSKQLSFYDSKEPITPIRKLNELSLGVILSNSYSTDELLRMYTTISGFGDGQGYRGAYLASYRLFNKDINKLNQLEILLLVETLKFSKGMLVNGKFTSTNDYESNKRDIRDFLTTKLQNFKNKGHLTEKEYKRIRRKPLRLSVQNLVALANNEQETITTPVMSTGTRHFLSAAPKGKTTISSINVEALQAARSADSLFDIEMSSHKTKGGFKLINLGIAIDIKRAKVISHWGEDNVLADYTRGNKRYGFTFNPVSTNKPLFMALALNNGLKPTDKLYDGPRNKWSPRNHDHYTFEYKDLEWCLAESPNVPYFNMPITVNVSQTIKDFEVILKEIGADAGPFDQNITLGYNSISIFDLSRLYLALFNDGQLKNLNAYAEHELKSLPIFKSQNANQVKEWLRATTKYGTGKHLKSLLPANDTFYSKSGTSNINANTGWYVLANDDILIVSMVTYMNPNNLEDPFKDRPSIPYRSGAKTAGYFSLYFMKELLKTRKE